MQKKSEHNNKSQNEFTNLKASLAKDQNMQEIFMSSSIKVNEDFANLFKLNQDLKQSMAIAAAAAPFTPKFETTALQMFLDTNRKARAFSTVDLSRIAIAATVIQTDYRDLMKINGIAETLNAFDIFKKQSLKIASIEETISLSNVMSEIVQNSLKVSALSEKTLSDIVWANLSSEKFLRTNSIKQLKIAFGGLNNSYFNLFDSLQKNPLAFNNINSSITKFIPREYYTSSNLLNVISIKNEATTKKDDIEFVELKEINESSLRLYLPKVNPALLKMWIGAVQTLDSDNIEKERHFTVSIRELFRLLLQELAPDIEIKNWSQNPQHFDKNKPIRRARLEFIYRNIDNADFGIFFQKDIDATLSFIDIFNKSTHNADNCFTDKQLHAIKVKAETTLNFILEVHFNSK